MTLVLSPRTLRQLLLAPCIAVRLFKILTILSSKHNISNNFIFIFNRKLGKIGTVSKYFLFCYARI